MICRYGSLSQHPKVFQTMTGLQVAEFDQLVVELLPRYEAAEAQRLSRPDRQRAIGGGRRFTLEPINQLLLAVVWLRQYPTYRVLGYLFGLDETAVGRLLKRVVPVLEAAGWDTMRRVDPGQGHRQPLDDLVRETPELAVLIDTFEQRVQRPRDRQVADSYYSGKKKQHTLKVQVAIDEQTGEVVDLSPSVPGPTADLSLLKQSGLLERLPPGVGALGDLAYVGIANHHPQGLGATPRRKPRGQPRPPEDVTFNTAFARRRVPVEHTIGRLRHYQCLTQTDRHHRQLHSAPTAAVSGLVNHQLRQRGGRAA